MKTKSRARTSAVGLTAMVLSMAGCGRGDTRINSDPGPGKPSSADGGDRTVRSHPNDPAHTSAPGAWTNPSTGTDSTGRPSDASGGTTGAGAGSNTSGTTSGKPEETSRK